MRHHSDTYALTRHWCGRVFGAISRWCKKLSTIDRFDSNYEIWNFFRLSQHKILSLSLLESWLNVFRSTLQGWELSDLAPMVTLSPQNTLFYQLNWNFCLYIHGLSETLSFGRSVDHRHQIFEGGALLRRYWYSPGPATPWLSHNGIFLASLKVFSPKH